MKTKTTNYTINKSNIATESFYNLCQLQEKLGYADPIGAIRSLDCEWFVEKDECGNIVSVQSE